MTFTFTVPATLAPGQYGVTATGQTSGFVVNSTYTLVAGATPVATAAVTMTPTPAAAPATQPIAPPMTHDERWFSQTGYRIDDDGMWAFFQQYGGITTFGYPTSRIFTFLGCPVQMFQRQVIQNCPSQGVALINLLAHFYTPSAGTILILVQNLSGQNLSQSPVDSSDRILNLINLLIVSLQVSGIHNDLEGISHVMIHQFNGLEGSSDVHGLRFGLGWSHRSDLCKASAHSRWRCHRWRSRARARCLGKIRIPRVCK